MLTDVETRVSDVHHVCKNRLRHSSRAGAGGEDKVEERSLLFARALKTIATAILTAQRSTSLRSCDQIYLGLQLRVSQAPKS